MAPSNTLPRGADAWLSVRPPRLSFNLRLIPGVTMMFPGESVPERLALARQHGFSGVEGTVPENPLALRHALEAEGMRCVCLSLGRGNTEAEALGIAALPGREAAFRDAILRGIEAASILSCSLIHPVGGLVAPSERSTYEAIYRENLRFACEAAAEANIQVVIEPICAARQPQYVLHTHAAAIDTVRSVDARNLGVMADMYHGRMSDESLPEIVRQHADSIPLLQVADAPVRRQPSAQDAQLQATFDALAAQHWQGWVSAEYVPEGSLSESLAWTHLLRAESRVSHD